MRISRFAVIGILTGVLAGCSAYTQTTSGHDWLAAYPPAAGAPAAGGSDFDAKLRAAAAVEPTLRFPARIGIARVGASVGNERFSMGPSLVPIPEDDARAWQRVADKLGPAFGSFVPISPMVAAMVESDDNGSGGINRVAQARHIIETIRLAAARQHLDAVLVYEADGTADAHSNPLSLAEWTLIGAFVLPSQDVKAVGVAQAMLLDVRNGYPYGQVTSTVDDSTQAVRFHMNEAQAALSQKVAGAAIDKLADETEGMMRKLKTDLAALDTPHPAH